MWSERNWSRLSPPVRPRAAGLALDADGPRGGYLAAAVCAGLAVVVCLIGLPVLRPAGAARERAVPLEAAVRSA
jgi:hypothetical protein